jgi:hypothetical protein
LLIWVKFHTETFHVMTFSGCEFHEIRCTERYTVLQGVSDSLPTPYILSVRYG